MQHNLINILPHDRIRAFRRTYFLHVFSIAILVGVFLILAHGALLLPAYTYEKIVIAKLQEQLSGISTRAIPSEEQKNNDRIQLLTTDSTYLTRLSESRTVSTAIRTVLAIPRPDISLSSLGFYASTTDQKTQMVIFGVAASRTALRQYVNAFSETSGIESADVPISAYAAETKIPFSLTLMGSLFP